MGSRLFCFSSATHLLSMFFSFPMSFVVAAIVVGLLLLLLYIYFSHLMNQTKGYFHGKYVVNTTLAKFLLSVCVCMGQLMLDLTLFSTGS